MAESECSSISTRCRIHVLSLHLWRRCEALTDLKIMMQVANGRSAPS